MGCNTRAGCYSPSVTGQPGQRFSELSGLFVQVTDLTGQPDSSDTFCAVRVSEGAQA
jgi:hypothetical protein